MTRTDRVSRWRVAILFAVAAVIAMPSAAPAQTPKEKKKRPDIYDQTADGEKQIAEALVAAKRDNKRVLLQFGANWCGWCHKLHELFKKDRSISRKLLYEYVVVLIDVDKIDGKPHNAKVNERFGNPTRHGLPVLVVLDADGKQLTTKNTAELEEGGDHHDPAKVLAFLEKWQPKPQSADEVLSLAMARAKSGNKNVFVHFSAPWCGYCKLLDAYLHRPEIEAVFGSAFVPVKIDVDRMTGAKTIEKKHRGEMGGIPFFVILDSSGKTLADSKGPNGKNVGFPVEPQEIAHFIDIVRKTTPRRLTDEQIETLEDGLKQKKN